MEHIKVVVVGDGTVGKTSLLIAYTLGCFPRGDYVPTVFDNYNAVVKWDDRKVNIGLWDTAGQEEFQVMRPISYADADVFLVMFSIASPVSYDNIKNKWLKEIEPHRANREVPVLLVGTKADVRNDAAAQEALEYRPVTFSKGKKLAREIGALTYLECSAVDMRGFRDIFSQCVASLINLRRGKKAGKVCWNTACENKLSMRKRRKCVRCQHYFCLAPECISMLPKSHDYKGKYMCVHCLEIDAEEPLLKKRRKNTVVADDENEDTSEEAQDAADEAGDADAAVEQEAAVEEGAADASEGAEEVPVEADGEADGETEPKKKKKKKKKKPIDDSA